MARELVPGDLIILKIGDVVPADGLLQEGGTCDLDQSGLTGESLPVKKSPGMTYRHLQRALSLDWGGRRGHEDPNTVRYLLQVILSTLVLWSSAASKICL